MQEESRMTGDLYWRKRRGKGEEVGDERSILGKKRRIDGRIGFMQC